MTGRRFALCLVAVLLAWSPLWASASQEATHTAGIYIDFGNGETTMVLVPFSEDEISGIDLMERSSLPILTVGFGGLGDAVCMIEQTGCDLSSCRRTLCQDGDRESPFWQYMQRSANGEWVTSPLGASAGKVQDGDIDAWVWTGKPPELPALTLDDILARTGAPKGNEPAVYTTATAANGGEDSSRQWLIGGGMIAIALIAGGSLIVLRKRQHATR